MSSALIRGLVGSKPHTIVFSRSAISAIPISLAVVHLTTHFHHKHYTHYTPICYYHSSFHCLRSKHNLSARQLLADWFEPTISASQRTHTYQLDRAATATGSFIPVGRQTMDYIIYTFCAERKNNFESRYPLLRNMSVHFNLSSQLFFIALTRSYLGTITSLHSC